MIAATPAERDRGTAIQQAERKQGRSDVGKPARPSAPITLARAVGYGVGDFGMNLYWHTLSTLLLFWYTKVVGLDPRVAGAIFFIGTIIDALSDPFMAVVAERTRTRWGGYRPYLLFGGGALATSCALLFWIPPVTGTALVAALIVTHILFRVCYTAVGVPYSALSSRITQDGRARTLLSGVRMTFAYLGLFAISSLAFPIVEWVSGDATNPEGFFVFALICGIASMTAFSVCFASTRETLPPSQIATITIRAHLSELLQSARTNGAIHTMLVTLFFQAAAFLVFFSTLTFYVSAGQSLLADKEVVLAVNSAAMLLMTPVWTYVARQIGKRTTWMAVTLLTALVSAHLATEGHVLIAGIPLQVVIMGAVFSAYGVLVWSMIPDTIEYGEWMSGIRSEAAIFGLSLFVQKLSIGLAGLALGFVMNLTLSDVLDPLAQFQRLELILAIGPAALLLLSLIGIWLHPVSAGRHNSLIAQLNTGEKP